MKNAVLIFLILPGAAAMLHAQSTSPDGSVRLLYATPGGSIGGGTVTGSGITGQISVGDPMIGGVSNVTAGQVQTKGNLVGQFYDVDSLAVSAAPGTVDEDSSRQMTALATMDDSTLLAVDAGNVHWTESGAFLTGVDPGGEVTAGVVYQNEPGQNVSGTYFGVSDADGFDLTVVNINADDFGSYAGDGIDDDWQVGYFGLDNPDAAPGENPDHDPFDNEAEFLTGFDPKDPAQFFQVTMGGFSGPTTAELTLNKVIPGRTYTLRSGTDLMSFPTTVGTPFSVVSEETDQVLQDTAATGDAKFYLIEVTRP